MNVNHVKYIIFVYKHNYTVLIINSIRFIEVLGKEQFIATYLSAGKVFDYVGT